ncbi:16881_t:CDS:2, partial [Racocetra fulgida]
TLPLKPNLKYTQLPGVYPIPNNYKIEVFWGHIEKNHIQASIDYIEGIPNYTIEWTNNEQKYIIILQILPSDAASKYCNLTKVIPKKNHPWCAKPLSDLGNDSYRDKTKRAAKSLFNDFEIKKKKIWHLTDNSKLKEIVMEVGEQPWLVKFDENQQLEKKKGAKNKYRALTTASQDLPKE